MSSLPPPWDPDDDADERYRRVSDLDPSRPSEATRGAVLTEAARRAAGYARSERRRRGLSLLGVSLGWRPAVVGTLAAVAVVGIVVAPQFLAPPAPPAQVARAPLAPPIAAAPAPAAPASQFVPEEPALRSSAQTAPRAAPPVLQRQSQPRLALQESKLPESNSARAASAPRPAAPAADGASAPGKAGSYLSETYRGLPPEASAAKESRARSAAPVAPAADPGALRHAAEVGDLGALAAQLAQGGEVDARDALGRTALMLATLNGRSEAVDVLLAHGADPNLADAHGVTPLAAARAAGEGQIAAALERHGAR